MTNVHDLDLARLENRVKELEKLHAPNSPPHDHPDIGVRDGRVDGRIHPSAVIADCVSVGKNVVIGPNVVIGNRGFGYTTNEWGAHHWRPHPYGVTIRDNVEIGAGVVIDRGRWRNTVIGEGTKIDANVFIAHNCLIGKDCLIIANSQISGSCEIGDNCHIGPAAMLTDHVKVGNGGRCGLGAVVIRDVPAGITVVGNPAKDIEQRRQGSHGDIVDQSWAVGFGDGSDEFSLPVPRPDHSELGQRQRAAQQGWQSKCR